MKFDAPRKTVKEQIEATPQIAELEAHYYKNPRENLKEVMENRTPNSVGHFISNEFNTTIHTHPNYKEPSLPSFQDLYTFNNETANSMVIAATNKEGKVVGYTFVNKNQTKDQPRNIKIEDSDFNKEKILYDQVRREIEILIEQLSRMKSTPENQKQRNDLIEKWNLRIDEMTKMAIARVEKNNWRMRFVPMKGYQFKKGFYISKPPDQATGGVKVLINNLTAVTSNLKVQYTKLTPTISESKTQIRDEEIDQKRKDEEELKRQIELNNKQKIKVSIEEDEDVIRKRKEKEEFERKRRIELNNKQRLRN